MKTCEQIQSRLTACLLGDLPEGEATEIRRHLDECEGCRAAAQEIEPTLDLLRDALAATTFEAPQRLDSDYRRRIAKVGIARDREVVSEQLAVSSDPSPVAGNDGQPSSSREWWVMRCHPRLTVAAAAVVLIGFFAAIFSVLPALHMSRTAARERFSGRNVRDVALSRWEDADHIVEGAPLPEAPETTPTRGGRTSGSGSAEGEKTIRGWRYDEGSSSGVRRWNRGKAGADRELLPAMEPVAAEKPADVPADSPGSESVKSDADTVVRSPVVLKGFRSKLAPAVQDTDGDGLADGIERDGSYANNYAVTIRQPEGGASLPSAFADPAGPAPRSLDINADRPHALAEKADANALAWYSAGTGKDSVEVVYPKAPIPASTPSPKPKPQTLTRPAKSPGRSAPAAKAEKPLEKVTKSFTVPAAVEPRISDLAGEVRTVNGGVDFGGGQAEPAAQGEAAPEPAEPPPGMEKLKVELPKPTFVGTPKSIKSPNLEPTKTDPRWRNLGSTYYRSDHAARTATESGEGGGAGVVAKGKAPAAPDTPRQRPAATGLVAVDELSIGNIVGYNTEVVPGNNSFKLTPVPFDSADSTLSAVMDKEALRRVAGEDHGRQTLKEADKAFKAGDSLAAIHLYGEAGKYLGDRDGTAVEHERIRRGLAGSKLKQDSRDTKAALTLGRADEERRERAWEKREDSRPEMLAQAVDTRKSGSEALGISHRGGETEEEGRRIGKKRLEEVPRMESRASTEDGYFYALQQRKNALHKELTVLEAQAPELAVQSGPTDESVAVEGKGNLSRSRMAEVVEQLEAIQDVETEHLAKKAAERDEVREKLKEIKIPEIDFRQADIKDVVNFLSDASKKQSSGKDGDSGGVAIELYDGFATATGTVAPDDPFGDAADPGATGGGETPLVTFHAKDVSLEDALRIVTSVSGQKYRIDDGKVKVVPLDAPDTDIVTRFYDIPAHVRERVRNIANEVTGDRDAAPDWEAMFKTTGVDWPSSASIRYIPEVGKLVVANTPRNLAQFEEVFEEITARVEPEPEPDDKEDEEFRVKAYGVNPFREAAQHPFSTFSIDVDTASYTLARNHMSRGLLPPAEAVRTEEFVNFFDYGYKAPAHETFRVFVKAAPSKFGRGLHMLKIGVKGRRLGREEQRPAMLTFLIDTSGSMNQADRLGLVRKSLRLLVEKLGPRDRIAVVQYDSHARLVLEPTAASDKKKILAAIDGMQCGGSTNLEEGMARAYAIAAKYFVPGGENRVLLLSDGVANLGAVAAEDILKQVEGFRRQGITCSVFGFGMGSYDDEMLEGLANKGDGNYTFIDSEAEARRVFVDDLSATLNTIAADVKIQVEFRPRRVKRYRQLGYENRQLKDEQFRDDTVDAGEVGSGQSVTALYEMELARGGSQASDLRFQDLGVVRVRYRRIDTGRVEEIAYPIRASDLVNGFNDADVHFRLAACVAEFAEILRGSPFAAGSEYAHVANELRPVALDLGLDNRVQELLRLVSGAGGMSRGE